MQQNSTPGNYFLIYIVDTVTTKRRPFLVQSKGDVEKFARLLLSPEDVCIFSPLIVVPPLAGVVLTQDQVFYAHFETFMNPLSREMVAKPSSEEVKRYVSSLVFELKAALSARRSHQGPASTTSVEVDCPREIFEYIAKDKAIKEKKERDKTSTKLEVVFEGEAGMAEMESIFGDKFHERLHPSGTVTFVRFLDDEGANVLAKLCHKKRELHDGEVKFGKDKMSFHFKHNRD
jgi:hypothetical protein